jgi:hypothetical protein
MDFTGMIINRQKNRVKDASSREHPDASSQKRSA